MPFRVRALCMLVCVLCGAATSVQATQARYNSLWFNSAGEYYQDGYPVSQILALEGGLAGGNASAVFNTLVQVSGDAALGFRAAVTCLPWR